MLCSLVLLACLASLVGGSWTPRNVTVTVKDPNPLLGSVSRRFVLANVPTFAASTGRPSLLGSCAHFAPLVIGLHGQGGSPETWKSVSTLTSLAKRKGFILALPAGIRETVVSGTSGKDSDTTWNVESADDDSTCLANTTNVQCLQSCHKAGLCSGRCNCEFEPNPEP